jgi:hypothetical protein
MTLHLLICISKMAATQLSAFFIWLLYIEDTFYNCMHVNCRNWKWDFELNQIKWDKNEWQPWNIRGSWSVWKSEAANPYTGLYSLCKMFEIHEIGGVRHQIYQRIIFYAQLAGINLDSWTLDKLLFTNLIFLAPKLEVPTINTKIIIFARSSTQVKKNG